MPPKKATLTSDKEPKPSQEKDQDETSSDEEEDPLSVRVDDKDRFVTKKQKPGQTNEEEERTTSANDKTETEKEAEKEKEKGDEENDTDKDKDEKKKKAGTSATDDASGEEKDMEPAEENTGAEQKEKVSSKKSEGAHATNGDEEDPLAASLPHESQTHDDPSEDVSKEDAGKAEKGKKGKKGKSSSKKAKKNVKKKQKSQDTTEAPSTQASAKGGVAKKTKVTKPHAEPPAHDSGSFTSRRAEEIQKRKDHMMRSKSVKAGLMFPVGRMKTQLRRHKVADRIGAGAPIYTAAVLEYMVAELVEMAGNSARDNKRKRITSRDLMLAVRNDEEFNKLLRNVDIPEGGVIPNIHQALMPKRKHVQEKEGDAKRVKVGA